VIFEDQLNEVQVDRFLSWWMSSRSLRVNRWQITA